MSYFRCANFLVWWILSVVWWCCSWNFFGFELMSVRRRTVGGCSFGGGGFAGGCGFGGGGFAGGCGT